MAPNTDVYSRPECNESERDKYVADLIDRLHDLERKTDPKLGARSARGKHRAALHALSIIGELVNALAGWALDHQAGLALKDLEFVELRTTKTPVHPNYPGPEFAYDDHRHEWYGRNWVGRDGAPIDPIVARRWLMQLVQTNPGIFNWQLSSMTLSALEACDYGETHPMFRPTKKDRKVNWPILRSQLIAIALVKYREARCGKKYKALEEVAGAFGVSVNTLHSWETRLQADFSRSEIAHRLAMAEEIGKMQSDAPDQDPLYGRDSLQRHGQLYKQALKKRSKRVTRR
jgi:hypothetical protein